MMRIKAGDADRWLKEQDRKWRCTACGGSLYWTEETCHHCGKTIRQIQTS
jgi:DNA-directed RNA polymerase subunit RPC12/RpoP